VLKPQKMSHLTTTSKIQKFIDETITGQFGNWLELLSDGDLRTFESELFDSLMAVDEKSNCGRCVSG